MEARLRINETRFDLNSLFVQITDYSDLFISFSFEIFRLNENRVCTLITLSKSRLTFSIKNGFVSSFRPQKQANGGPNIATLDRVSCSIEVPSTHS